MGHSHVHIDTAPDDGGRESRNLLIALVLNISITIAQVVGGLVAGSLSLLADAAHNASDAASLGISYGARRIAGREADRQRTFGYNRAEVIGAMINLVVLVVIAVYLMGHAVSRLLNPSEVGGMVMLVVGGVAFVEDALSAYLLHRDARDSVNVRSAFLHMVGDTLATLGVIVSGLLVVFFDFHLADAILTALIAVYLLIHSTIELRGVIRLLMESTPRDLDFEELVQAVASLDDVQDIHHIHIWRLDEERVALEAHVAIPEMTLGEMERVKRRIKTLLQRRFGIDHATLEMECEACRDHGRPIIAEE